ncbi:hypothetical protein C8Q75DRAFT_277893 [Abortiporus biennis]|nr:hypothetical protein C8Q75DRAFT_277893 [Abortiporus biennis]
MQSWTERLASPNCDSALRNQTPMTIIGFVKSVNIAETTLLLKMKIPFVVLLAAPLALAFSDTHPLVVWASKSSVLSSTTSPESFVGGLLSDGTLCETDTIFVVDQPGLHASHLRHLSTTSNLFNAIHSAPFSVQYPYLRPSDVASSTLAADIAKRCNAQLVDYSVGDARPDSVSNKLVVHVQLPAAGKSAVADAENYPSHLVIYSSWNSPSSHKYRRAQASNVAAPSGGVLQRYQLLTPGLIISLLIAFFVLVPGILLGVSALASIQSPLRGESAKGFSAIEKKNQ